VDDGVEALSIKTRLDENGQVVVTDEFLGPPEAAPKTDLFGGITVHIILPHWSVSASAKDFKCLSFSPFYLIWRSLSLLRYKLLDIISPVAQVDGDVFEGSHFSSITSCIAF